MAGTRLERLAKSDRDYVVGFITDTHCNLFPPVDAFLKEQAHWYEYRFQLRLSSDAEPGQPVQSHLESYWTLMSRLKFQLQHYATKARLLEDDMSSFVRFGRLRARVEYCLCLCDSEAYSGGDCYHIWGAIWALAVADFDAVRTFATRWPGQSKQGHRLTREMCNGVTSLLLGQPKPSSFEKALAGKLGKNEAAELNCLDAIFNGDEARFKAELERSIASYRATATLDALMKFFCWRSHGLMQLARLIHGNHFASDFSTRNVLWDEALDKIMPGSPDSSLLKTYSQSLAELVETLPLSPSDDMFESLRVK